MFDINFYMRFHQLRKDLDAGKKYSRIFLEEKLEEIRSKNPIVYNIETTNACNMKCQMCPRTTMMTRPIETITKDIFIKVIDQLKPHSENDWLLWKKFVEDEYCIKENDMSENHFFLYIIPKVIQLHGYGDPLLDKNMGEYVSLLKKRGFYSYFSCNPSNINLEQTNKMLVSGLDYIKYSIESVDDEAHKKIRGEASNFGQSYNKILKVLDFKKRNNINTTIIITMLDLNRKNQKEDYEKLREAFKNLDIYLYLKSEDQQWYRKDFHGTKSVHWSEVCKHPWMSISIKSNAEVAMCMEDFNNEIILGDASKESLFDIWNGQKYVKFRNDHLNKNSMIKCTNQCDMKIIGDYL
ncbi:MAG: radical SAM protein [Spirochaetes bacterium]|nr:radical SAM protein [Spirochaetota bacterium]